MENSTFTALDELGILCRSTDVASQPGATDPGPHAYRGHHQLCQYEDPRHRFPYPDKSIALYHLFGADTSLDTALKATPIIILLGATHSEEMRRCLDNPDTIVLVFEPDENVLADFLKTVRVGKLAQQNVFLFLGEPYSFAPSLQELLPSGVFRKGTPAIFQTARIATDHARWAEQVTEYVEILHYRHAVYPLSNQLLTRSRPLRAIKRDHTFDQQLHAFENIPDYCTAPDLSQLKNRLAGHSAILVAAGPSLTEKLSYIKANRSRAVIICVNNALKPLAEAGIKPHFTVINDTSLASGEVFDHIPRQPGTILVGHCLSDLGGDKFIQKYLFGDHMESIFPKRPDLDLHGSVISTAFSLARHMGCARCVIVGGQLASYDPWRLSYAKGTTNHAPDEPEQPLTHKHPQHYPTPTPFGETMYTTLNFRDAALWLAEEIRLSAIDCHNTTKSSILYGSGIAYDSEPSLPEGSINRVMADLFKPQPPRINTQLVLQHIRHEIANWTNIRNAARELASDTTDAVIIKGNVVLKQLDKTGVTFTLERYHGFDNHHFYRLVFAGSPADQAEGYRYYFDHLGRMAADLLHALTQSEQACRNRVG